MENWEVTIVGGGAAGLMAACRAAQRGRRALLMEKKSGLGTKILMSGGTRCNITHVASSRDIVRAFGQQGNFLHSALAGLSPQGVVDLFEAEGVATKSEPNGKIFPASDEASDVLGALAARLRRTNCAVALGEAVSEIRRTPEGFELVTATRTIAATKLIITSGGQSYPACGTQGDGYRWAAALGHTVVPPRPALVPITTHAPWVTALKGITLPDVMARVLDTSADAARPPCLAECRSALLFAHFGVTGPAALNVSRAVSGHASPGQLILRIDLLPDVKLEALEAAVQEECRTAGKRLALGILAGRMPQRVAETVAERAAIAPARRAAELSRTERQALVRGAKQFDIPVAGTMGFRKAEVTAGGIALDEVDSRTMQSKLVPGVYFAGEVLDLDGPIGGYNFQAAFSTGWLAGECV